MEEPSSWGKPSLWGNLHHGEIIRHGGDPPSWGTFVTGEAPSWGTPPLWGTSLTGKPHCGEPPSRGHLQCACVLTRMCVHACVCVCVHACVCCSILVQAHACAAPTPVRTPMFGQAGACRHAGTRVARTCVRTRTPPVCSRACARLLRSLPPVPDPGLRVSPVPGAHRATAAPAHSSGPPPCAHACASPRGSSGGTVSPSKSEHTRGHLRTHVAMHTRGHPVCSPCYTCAASPRPPGSSLLHTPICTPTHKHVCGVRIPSLHVCVHIHTFLKHMCTSHTYARSRTLCTRSPCTPAPPHAHTCSIMCAHAH
ncbi:putative protein CRIPAK [Grus americana]|uniref:putative protein CRIPAK n=1 Tax=Grus americana TaxID=9117 RepID=UPI0024084433|nr:putative protein CRIPAK [Grus americana]